MRNYLIISLLLVSISTDAQNNRSPQINIQIACGWAGVTSVNINNVHTLVKTKTYSLLRVKLFSQNRLEALLTVIVLKELTSSYGVELTAEELTRISEVVNWTDNYSLCYTCTEHFEGTVNELLTNETSSPYQLIKQELFKSN